ncbi:MAG TPA: hypothetical protein PLS49_03340 [Candidatus Woesebacteria bacterium]|nr:hypothetical protein [Candidatus Woesebacteria bacterium]
MKLYIWLVTFLFAGFITVPVIAQTTTPKASPTVKTTPTESDSDLDSEVDKLKEKVAETVSEMRGKTEKAISGVVQSITKSELVINDKYTARLDNTLTKYYEIAGTSTKDLNAEDIKKGDYVFVRGPEISSEITANAVYKDTPYMVLTGKITEVNSEDYTVKIISLDKINYTLDIQTRTNQQMLNIKTLEVEKIGFSKLKEGDSIHVVVQANLENANTTRFDAERFLIIPNEYFIQ